jgi:phage tail-like protein
VSFLPPQAHQGPVGSVLNPVGAYNFWITLIDSPRNPATASAVQQLQGALLAVESMVLAGFSECTGLEMQMQPEDRRVGGRNDAVLKFPTRVTYANIRLRRGVAISDDLWNWHHSFVHGKGKRRDGMIVLQNDQRVPVRTWVFQRALPMRWSGPALDAGQGRVAIEELEIAHEGLELASIGAAAGELGLSI